MSLSGSLESKSLSIAIPVVISALSAVTAIFALKTGALALASFFAVILFQSLGYTVFIGFSAVFTACQSAYARPGKTGTRFKS